MNETVTTRTRVKSLEERRAVLEEEAKAVAKPDGRVALESSTSAVVTKGKPVTGPLHVILTVLTLGLWGIVWFTLAKTRGEKRWRVTVNEYGQASTERI